MRTLLHSQGVSNLFKSGYTKLKTTATLSKIRKATEREQKKKKDDKALIYIQR